VPHDVQALRTESEPTMTVYVWRNSTTRPQLQHLLNPDSDRQVAYCGTRVDSAEYHSQGRCALRIIDYTTLPMCKRCQKANQA
jgi:hypothetical protein